MNYHFQGCHPPQQLATMITVQNQQYINSLSGHNSSQWLTDFGCNAHITSDFNNLSISSEYNGEDNITVGNGHSLPIPRTSCGTISPSPNSSFHLTNLLYAPNASNNLLFFYQLCVGNNCAITFDTNKFVIQDNLIGTILAPRPQCKQTLSFYTLFQPSLCGKFACCSCWNQVLYNPFLPLA